MDNTYVMLDGIDRQIEVVSGLHIEVDATETSVLIRSPRREFSTSYRALDDALTTICGDAPGVACDNPEVVLIKDTLVLTEAGAFLAAIVIGIAMCHIHVKPEDYLDAFRKILTLEAHGDVSWQMKASDLAMHLLIPF